jgi:uncharacterized protein (TIGR00369 family)
MSERTRTFTWEDPLLGAAAARTMTGIEYLRAMERGELPPPPVAMALGSEIVEIAEGRVVFAMTPEEFHYNPIGSVHGGVITTICDSAMGCAVQSLLPAGTVYTTLELKVNFVRPLTVASGRMLCVGTVIHMGSRMATAEARLTDEAGKLYAHATTTCMVLKP